MKKGIIWTLTEAEVQTLRNGINTAAMEAEEEPVQRTRLNMKVKLLIDIDVLLDDIGYGYANLNVYYPNVNSKSTSMCIVPTLKVKRSIMCEFYQRLLELHQGLQRDNGVQISQIPELECELKEIQLNASTLYYRACVMR